MTNPVTAQAQPVSWISNPFNGAYWKKNPTAPADQTTAPASVTTDVTVPATTAPAAPATTAPAAPAVSAQDQLALKVEEARRKLSMTHVDKLYEDKVTNSGWLKYLSGFAILDYLVCRSKAVEADKAQGGDIKAFNAAALALVQALVHRNLTAKELDVDSFSTLGKKADLYTTANNLVEKSLNDFYATFRTRVNQIVPDKNNTGDIMIHTQAATKTLEAILATVDQSNNVYAKKWYKSTTAAEKAAHGLYIQTKMDTVKEQLGKKVFVGSIEDFAGVAGESLASISSESVNKKAEELHKFFPGTEANPNTVGTIRAELLKAIQKTRKDDLTAQATKLRAAGNTDEVEAIAQARKLELEAKHKELDAEFLRIRGGDGKTVGEMEATYKAVIDAYDAFAKASAALTKICTDLKLTNLTTVEAMAQAQFGDAKLQAAQAAFNTAQTAVEAAIKAHNALYKRADELVKFAPSVYVGEIPGVPLTPAQIKQRDENWMGKPLTVAGTNNSMIPTAGLLAELNASLDPTILKRAAEREAQDRADFYTRILNGQA